MVWLGRRNGIESDIVSRNGIPFEHVRTGPMVGAGVFGRLRSAFRMVIGALDVARMIGRDRPDAIFVTGGYVSMPVAIAARLRRVPLAMYLPDARPGRAAAWIAKLADRVFVTHEDVAPYVGGEKAHATGYPVRSGLRETDRRSARTALGLESELPVVLVFGGSQGSRQINQAVAQASASLLGRVQILHVSGTFDHEAASERADSLSEDVRSNYHLHDYLHGQEMNDALAAADLVVSRSGAAILGEYPARALPSILVPLPISRGHQWDNARLLQAAGAASIIADEDLDGLRLESEISLLLDDPAVLERMGTSCGALDRPDAASAIANGLLSLRTEASAA